MNLIIISMVIAASSAAQLPSRNYIPQNQAGGGQYQGGGGQYQGVSGFGGSGGSGNTRAQQQQEKNAAILKQDLDISDTGSYHFGYETENGIRAEEQGDTSNAQGGFAYKGDDGHTYTITYTSGEGGFRPQGEHIPVPPPTPEAILEALQQNAKDEAAGIFDDGKYKPDVHGGPGVNRPGLSAHGGFGGGSGSLSFGGSSGSHHNGFQASSGYTY